MVAAPFWSGQFCYLAAGQEYIPSLKGSHSKIVPMLSGATITPNDEPLFRKYYLNYGFARWRVPENINQLPKFRGEFRTDLGLAKAADVHNRLTAMALEFFPDIAKGSDPPTVRVNAALMVGELNVKEWAGNVPSKPLSAAIDPLLAMVNAKEQLDAVKAAALVGLVRHAETGIEDDEARQQVSNAMVKLVDVPLRPGPAAEGQAWIKSQGIEILGMLGGTGENNAVPELLGKFLGDADMPLSVRRAAAHALGRLNYLTAGVHASTLAVAVGKFAVTACRHAKTELEEGKTVSVPAVKTYLLAAKTALSGFDPQHAGIAGAAKGTAADETFVATVLEKVEKLLETIEAPDGGVANAIQKTEAAAGELGAFVEKSS
jgi:hypothetical protein